MVDRQQYKLKAEQLWQDTKYLYLIAVYFLRCTVNKHTQKKNEIDLAIHFDIIFIRIGTEFILNYDAVRNFNCPYQNSVVNATKPKKRKKRKKMQTNI